MVNADLGILPKDVVGQEMLQMKLETKPLEGRKL
jgi:hypothetical protein